MGTQAVGSFERVASGVYLEGLAFDFKRNAVWYSDVIKGGVHGIYPDGKVVTLNEGRMWTGGVLMNDDGAVLSTGAGGIMWNNPDSGKAGWLLHEIEGQVINGINELVPDGTGGIFFGTNDIEMVEKAQPTRPTAIYRLTADRKVVKLVDGMGFTNGIMYDAVRKRFYCNDTFSRVWAFDVNDDRTLSNKRVLLEKEDCDGMALDAEGNVWITGFRSNFLTRLRPDGTELPRIDTPAGAVTQIRFGGADLRDYYINVVPIDGGDSLKDGKPLTSPSIMYRGRSDVAGLAVQAARFKLA